MPLTMPTIALTPRQTSQREFATNVVRALRRAGHEALWAGGCVRDLLRGEAPKDYDVATSAHPPRVLELFPRALTVGIQFGVVRVLGKRGMHDEVEVATFRTDGCYVDGRRPTDVVFATAEEDALRRDFTINGIFYDPIDDHLLDFVGGENDLRAGLVRAIGDPHQRFEEDKLRLLRAARFGARFGFHLEPTTADAVRAHADRLAVVSPERILAELRQMLTPPTRVTAMRLMRELHLLPVALPEVAAALGDDQAWRDILNVVGYWEDAVSLPLAVAGLLTGATDDEAPRAAETLFRRLRGPNDERERCVWLLRQRRVLDDALTLRDCVLKRLFSHPGGAELLSLHAAMTTVRPATRTAADRAFERRAAWTDADIDPPPLVTGDDLVRMGERPSERFRVLLDAIRDEQLDGALRDREAALARIRQLRLASIQRER